MNYVYHSFETQKSEKMPIGPGGIAAIQAGGQVAGPLLGMMYNSMTHGMQLQHQEDFMNQQIQGAEQIGLINSRNALDMWNKTNAEAQVEHFKNAGLNIGLMYGNATGAGGTTSGAGAQLPTGGTAPNAMDQSKGMGMIAAQMALMGAQIKNINADTANKEADSALKAANTGKVGFEIGQIQAQTDNIESQTLINGFNSRIAAVNADMSESGKSLKIATMNEEYNNLVANTKLQEAEKVQITAKTAEANAHVILMEAQKQGILTGIALDNAKIEQIGQSIAQEWEKIGLEKIRTDNNTKQVAVNQAYQVIAKEYLNFNTSTPQQIKQWQEIITNQMGAMAGSGKAAAQIIGSAL